MKKKFYAISLFSGAGGLDLGMETAGFTTRLCCDIDFHSCETMKQNKKRLLNTDKKRYLEEAEIIQANIKEFTTDEMLKAARLKKQDVSLVYGGPPCQSFSVFGQRKGMEDPRGTLLWDYLRVVRDIEPEAFVFENVAGLLTIDDGNVFKLFLEEIQNNHNGEKLYNVQHFLLDTSEYGVPQFRSRLIIVGSKKANVSIPKKTHSCEDQSGLWPAVTVRDVLDGMPLLPNTTLANHVGRNHSQGIIDRYANLSFGERDSKTRINKLHPDKPSYTIVVGSDKGGGKGHVHPFQPREVTPRESARIQTFPDDWAFSGTSRHPIRQIGNAVPPVFGAVIGAQVMHDVFKQHAVTYDEILNTLGLDYMPRPAPTVIRQVI